MQLKDELRTQWGAMASHWIENVGQDAHRVGLLDHNMMEVLGDVSGKDVIDLGCGEGRFSRMMARSGASVTGVDFCRPFIDFAVANHSGSETYLHGDIEDLVGIPNCSFDIAVSYVNLVDVFDLDAVVREAYRVLRPDGRFIVCNLQPMVTAGNGWVKHWSTKLFFKLDDYFDEGERVLPIGEHNLINVHRTLSTYVNSFLRAGFVLERLVEPKPTEEQVQQFPDIEDNLRVPLFIIYELRRQDNSN